MQKKINCAYSKIGFALLVFCVCFISHAQNVYYVSPVGDDNNSGQITQPFKTIQKAANIVVAGDTVFVRAGTYREIGVDDPNRGKITFRIKTSGTSQAPIVFMAYPRENPVLDGADTLSTWVPCSSAADCGNNPNWQNMYHTNVPSFINASNSFLWEGDSLLYVAMDPEPADPFYWEQPSTWRRVPAINYTDTTIVDTSYFIQADSNYWNNAYVLIWSCNNNIMKRAVSSYNPITHKISFPTIGCPSFLDTTKDKYAMWNHIALINNQGEYYVDEQNSKIYLWPHHSNGGSFTISMAVRSKGADIRGNDYVVIDGLRFQHYSGDAITNYNFGGSYMADGVVIKNNLVNRVRGSGINMSGLSNSIAHNNRVTSAMGSGVHFGGGRNNVISNNYLERVASTGLRFYGVKNGKIINNENRNSNGQHANGITTYLSCDTILIEGNKIINSNIAYTFQSSSNLTVKNNLFMTSLTSTGNVIAGWNGSFNGGRPYNINIFNNTVLNSVYIGSDFTNILVKDNILGGLGSHADSTHSNNLFINLSWTQTYNLATYSESHEPDLLKIFNDPANEDFTLKNIIVGAPLVNPCTMSTTGAHVGAYPCLSTVGVDGRNKTENSLHIFPNPSNGIFTFNFTAQEQTTMVVSIVNIMGQVVYAETKNNIQGNYWQQLDLREHTAGLYFVEVQLGSVSMYSRIVKY